MRNKAQQYRLNAVNCVATAEATSDPAIRTDLLAMAQAWCTLADQAERNSQTDLVYETPEREQPGIQQQQQIQPDKK